MYLYGEELDAAAAAAAKSLSRVRLFATPWTAAHQAPPSMGLSRQEYWSGLPLPSPNFTIRTMQIHKQVYTNTYTYIHKEINI